MDGTYTPQWLLTFFIDPTTGPVNHPEGTVLHVMKWTKPRGRPRDTAEYMRVAPHHVRERSAALREDGEDVLVRVVTGPGLRFPESHTQWSSQVMVLLADLLPDLSYTGSEQPGRLQWYTSEWLDLVAHAEPLAEMPEDMTVYFASPKWLSAAKVDSIEDSVAEMSAEDLLPEDGGWWEEATPQSPTVVLVTAQAHTDPGFLASGLVLKVFVVVGRGEVLPEEDPLAGAIVRHFMGQIVPGAPDRLMGAPVLYQGVERSTSRWREPE